MYLYRVLTRKSVAKQSPGEGGDDVGNIYDVSASATAAHGSGFGKRMGNSRKWKWVKRGEFSSLAA